MGEVANIGCLVETMMVSNANEDGAEIEAAQILKRKLNEAEVSLGTEDLTELSCDRCGMTFLLQKTRRDRQAVVACGQVGENGQECDRRAGIYVRGASWGQSFMNLNLLNIEERG